MSWSNRYSQYAPYVPVAERRRKAEAAAKKANKAGKGYDPVKLEGKKISTSFWGKAWCDNLEAYSDYSNRLPRGRTYVRNGSVVDLQIMGGMVTGLVYGSSMYKIAITIAPMASSAWNDFKQRCAGKVSSLIDLLQGKLDKGVLEEITKRPGGLFPAPKEIKLSCSCPDGAYMCKHVAAVLYGVGARLDTSPEMFFTLRQTDMQELITAASQSATTTDAAPSDGGLEADDLSALFGVEIETAPVATAKPKAVKKAAKKATKPAPKPKKAVKKVAKKATKRAKA